MKTLFSFTAALILSLSAFAQSIDVPQTAIDHFNSDLPNTPVHWTQSNDQILGQFKNSGNPAGMRYEMDGTFVRKETRLPVSALPSALQTHLDENGATASVISAFKFEATNTQYLVNVGGTDHIFDADGALMGTYDTEPFSW